MKEMFYSTERLCYVLHKGTYKGFKFAIVNYGTHPCCYVFIPKNHKFYGKSYEEINIKCHGGLTYSDSELVFNPLKCEDWVIGWDYAHWDDYMGLYESLKYPPIGSNNYKKWTTKELFKEVKEVIEQLKGV